MATKIELLNSAYSWMRISGLTVNPTPEDVELGLHRMEGMLADFYGRTINLSYVFEDEPDPNTESGVERIHNKMISSNLATELCIDFGKEVPMKLSSVASGSWTASVAVIARERTKGVQYPERMPRGSGNRVNHNYRRFQPPAQIIKSDASNEIVYSGDVNDYVETFEAYLSTHGGTIDNFSIRATEGLTVVSSLLSTDKKSIGYRILASGKPDQSRGYEKVTITALTSTGRVESRIKSFEVIPLNDGDAGLETAEVTTLRALVVPLDLVASCTIFCDGAFKVDWGNGIFIAYNAGADAVAIPTGDITVENILGSTANQIKFKTDTYESIDLELSGTLTSMDDICIGLFELLSFDMADSSKVNTMRSAFSQCANLASFPMIDTSNVTDFYNTWYNCSSFVTFPAINTGKGIDFSDTWGDNWALSSFPFIDTTSGKIFQGIFSGDSLLPTFPPIDTSRATSLFLAFSGISIPTSVPLYSTTFCTDFRFMFSGCSGLTSVPLFDLSSGLDFEAMFDNCSGLTSIPPYVTSAGTSFRRMFDDCSGLTTVPLLDTANSVNFGSMFLRCTSLTSLPPFDTSAGLIFDNMFNGCTALICLSALDTTNETNTTNMFLNTGALVAPDGTEQTALLGGSVYVNGGACP